jgi:multidrug efflux pump subunit AcrB
MGMLLAIGMLVDNSVVITESIFRHRQLEPQEPVKATLKGVREVGVAVLAGTLSTIIVFLPMVFGEKNQMSIFLVHVAIPIIVAMLASLVAAQTLIPMLAARMTPPPAVARGSWFARLQDRYERALKWALSHHKTMAAIRSRSCVTSAAVRAEAREESTSRRKRLARCSSRITCRVHPMERSSRPCVASRPTSKPTRSARHRHLLLGLDER